MISYAQKSQPLSPVATPAQDAAGADKSAPVERATFDRLVNCYVAPLRCFLTRRVAGDAVEDVLQEVLIATWTTSQNTSASHLPALLYRIARCKAVGWFRGHARQASRETTLDEAYADTHNDFALLHDRMQIAALLEQLSPVQRETLKLYYEDGLTLAEIAARQGKGISVTKYHFYRAHEDIARLWKEEE